jgi:hypothetical protein
MIDSQVDAGAQIESQLCGTEFPDIQRIQFCVCIQGAWSGNPVLIGPSMWSIEAEWFIYFHEFGHNFTLASVRFNELYPFRGYISMGGDYWDLGTNFVEAWATMVGFLPCMNCLRMRIRFTSNISSGIYFYRLEVAGQSSLTKKCILMT